MTWTKSKRPKTILSTDSESNVLIQYKNALFHPSNKIFLNDRYHSGFFFSKSKLLASIAFIRATAFRSIHSTTFFELEITILQIFKITQISNEENPLFLAIIYQDNVDISSFLNLWYYNMMISINERESKPRIE